MICPKTGSTIRTGNAPDPRLIKFITRDMLAVAPAAREKFDSFKDLLAAFGSGKMSYGEFAARVRRRLNGSNEDNDWADEDSSQRQ